MKLNKFESNLLGLTKQELAVLNVLEVEKSVLVTKAAEVSGLPRTTVGFLLKKLKQRGLVEQIKVEQHKEWRIRSPEEISKKLQQICFKFNNTKNVLGNIASQNIEITAYSGHKNLKKAYGSMLVAGKNNRVFVIQGSLSAKASLKTIDWDCITNLHKDFRQNRIVMEGLMNNKTFKLFKKFSALQIKSHLDRLVVLYVIPDEYLDFELDVIFFADKIYFIDVMDEKIIFIKNKRLVKAFKNLFYLAESFGKKVDLNNYLKDLIKEK